MHGRRVRQQPWSTSQQRLPLHRRYTTGDSEIIRCDRDQSPQRPRSNYTFRALPLSPISGGYFGVVHTNVCNFCFVFALCLLAACATGGVVQRAHGGPGGSEPDRTGVEFDVVIVHERHSIAAGQPRPLGCDVRCGGHPGLRAQGIQYVSGK